MYRKMFWATLFLLFLSLPLIVTAQQPCGDGVCDQAEQGDPQLCPQDCTSPQNNMPAPESREQERARLPEVTEVEKWVLLDTISERENFAPSLVALKEGGYRIFWNSFQQGGITSATSPDGLSFTPDEGLRLANGAQGDPDCVASHPWVVALDEGYRMYYQGDAACRTQGDVSGQEPEFRILSAFSEDGLTFTREGVRVDIGEGSGLSQAAHGRILRLDDGTYRLYFSANFVGQKGPASIIGATSEDGLSWTLDAAPIVDGGHDPTVIELDGTVYIYTTFLRDNLLLLSSEDGYTFTLLRWLEFYDQSGQRIEEVGDIDILLTPDGRLLIYGSGKGAQGVGVFEQQ